MNFSERRGEYARNRKRFFKKNNIDANYVVRAHLIHRNRIEVVGLEDRGKIISNTDGLITNKKGVYLALTVADCLPIFLFEPRKRVIGLIHAGWRGLALDIIYIALKKMINRFKVVPENILAGVGPAICHLNYEVRDDVLKNFERFPQAVVRQKKKLFLDLKKIAEIQLLNLGLKRKNIEISPDCTFLLKDKYFSYRRDNPKKIKTKIKTMMAVIGMK